MDAAYSSWCHRQGRRFKVGVVCSKGGRRVVTALSRKRHASVSAHAMTTHKAALLRACCFLLLVAGSRQLSIKEFVVPKAVETGNAAELKCKYELASNETEQSLFVKWWWTADSSSSDYRMAIYQRIAGQPAESLHLPDASNIEIKADDTIVLTNVTPADSGVYECEVYNIDELRRHDRLVVFQKGTGPVLNISEIQNSTLDGQSEHLVIIECQADDVAPRPEITVSIEGKGINMTTVVEDDDHNGLYSIYANTSLSADEMGGSEVRCEIFFTDDNISHPPYVDVKTFVPAGYDSLSTTEAPEDATEPDATPESLQNPSDDGVRVHSSWWLLASAFALLSHLHTML